MQTPKTLLDAINYFSDAENCRKFMISVRWLDGIVRCPRCDSENVSYMPNAKQYHCKAKQHKDTKFSLKVGTIFEDSPIGLEKWLPAAWLISNCKNGISSYEIARALGVTQKSAWHMLHRLREAMNGGVMFKMNSPGPIEIDETHIGPKPQKMHANKRAKLSKEGYQKPVVMGMLDRESPQVRAKVVPNVKRETLLNEILNQIERGSKIYTDNWPAYDRLTAEQLYP
jgi:transposase-like protein